MQPAQMDKWWYRQFKESRRLDCRSMLNWCLHAQQYLWRGRACQPSTRGEHLPIRESVQRSRTSLMARTLSQSKGNADRCYDDINFVYDDHCHDLKAADCNSNVHNVSFSGDLQWDLSLIPLRTPSCLQAHSVFVCLANGIIGQIHNETCHLCYHPILPRVCCYGAARTIGYQSKTGGSCYSWHCLRRPDEKTYAITYHSVRMFLRQIDLLKLCVPHTAPFMSHRFYQNVSK